MPREGRAVPQLQAQGSLQRTMPSASRFINPRRRNQRIRIPGHRVERQEKHLYRPHRYQRYGNLVQAGHWSGSNYGVQASVGGARETSTPVTSSTALWSSQESFGSPGTDSLSPRPLWEGSTSTSLCHKQPPDQSIGAPCNYALQLAVRMDSCEVSTTKSW